VTNRAALYLRSSKDRSDVSIDAQRRALQEVAGTKGLVVVQEFADAVESGKDEDRPGFQALIRGLKDSGRAWEHVLVLDTSRVARRRHIAQIFEHECQRAGVRLHFKNVPDTDPVTGMLLKAILQAMDEWHSLTSKAKGLAGMAENVRQGWRAGGKAPRGYELEYHSTGALREGAPVLKSKLKVSAEAPLVAAYLRARAAGRPRGALISELQLPWTSGSLNDLGWMALTYAGHTAWGMTNELTNDGYVNGTKRKPRSDWTIQRDTHEALITDAEAEAILAVLERKRVVRVYETGYAFLLTGFLVTPDDQSWTGEWDSKMKAGLYRLRRGKRVSCRRVDDAVLDQLREDLTGEQGVQAILKAMRAIVGKPVDAKALAHAEKRLTQLTNKIGNLVDLLTEAEELERAAFRRSIAAHEAERTQLLDQLEAMRTQLRQADEARVFSEGDARRLLRVLFETFQGAVDAQDVETTKAALGGLVEKIVLDREAEHLHIHYRIGALAADTGTTVATLRGSDAVPVRFSTERSVPRPSGGRRYG
jgi:DNA invertase Pin-like site-specific DNA recombinase